jgi:hypothetical protein
MCGILLIFTGQCHIDKVFLCLEAPKNTFKVTFLHKFFSYPDEDPHSKFLCGSSGSVSCPSGEQIDIIKQAKKLTKV